MQEKEAKLFNEFSTSLSTATSGSASGLARLSTVSTLLLRVLESIGSSIHIYNKGLRGQE